MLMPPSAASGPSVSHGDSGLAGGDREASRLRELPPPARFAGEGRANASAPGSSAVWTSPDGEEGLCTPHWCPFAHACPLNLREGNSAEGIVGSPPLNLRISGKCFYYRWPTRKAPNHQVPDRGEPSPLYNSVDLEKSSVSSRDPGLPGLSSETLAGGMDFLSPKIGAQRTDWTRRVLEGLRRRGQKQGL